MIVTTIDTLYGHIVSKSVKFLTHAHRTFSVREKPNIHYSIPIETSEVPAPSINVEKPTSFKTVNEVLSTKSVIENFTTHPKNMVMYAVNTDVSIYKNPTAEFDSRIGSVPHGEMVMMLDIRRRFYQILWNELTGWVLKDDLVDRVAHIYPKFIIGEENLYDNPNTKHIRILLEDVFGVEQLDFPLQSGEYVLYRLLNNNLQISWPETRPRTPGLWHKILKGVPKIHIGVVPVNGSIMEYIFDDDFGHVVYVDKVLEDDTISISEVNYSDSGKYNERILTREEWIELRPVFIQVK